MTGLRPSSAYPSFSWNASDPQGAGFSSGIFAYSYILDSNENTTPDIIPEGNLSNLENETEKNYSGIADGTYHFHARARDRAGNWGNAMHYTIKVDTAPPTTPFMLSPDQNSTNGTISFQWNVSRDYSSGLMGYYITITRTDTGAYIENSTWIGNTTRHSMSGAENSVNYHATVKAKDNAGNIGLDSDSAGATYDNSAPLIIFQKPSGTVISTQPIIVLKTNEQANCYHDGVLFEYTNSTHHEARITASNGQSPTIAIECYDLSGNKRSETVSFTVNTALQPASVAIEQPGTPFYANRRAYFQISVENSGTGIGELRKEYFRVKLERSYLEDFTVNDNGNGNYTISFIAPATAGSYSVAIKAGDYESSAYTMEVGSFNIQIKYTGSISSPIKSEKMAYSTENEHLIGLASESRSADASNSTSGSLEIASELSSNAFIFVTLPDSKPESRQGYLKSGTFSELILPAFGYRVEKEKYTVNTELTYPYILITGERKLDAGTHSIIIKNNGLSADGKVNVTITTV
ncbi:MAG: hypothetical protein NTV63_03455 [Candidatus Woesearchaeota archaeon]|nr:hypothetical protein [Candidatus Woesearchaeota archaeon]